MRQWKEVIVLITNCPSSNLLPKKVLMIYNGPVTCWCYGKDSSGIRHNPRELGILTLGPVWIRWERGTGADEVIGALSEAHPQGARRQFVKSMIGKYRRGLAGGLGIRYRLCGRRTEEESVETDA